MFGSKVKESKLAWEEGFRTEERTIDMDTLSGALNQVAEIVDRLQGISVPEKFEENGRTMLLALNSVSVLEADIEAMDKKVIMTSLASIWVKAKGIIEAAIKAISKHLWQIIVGALTLKEWTLKGSLGTGIFGLASVEIGLKFGP